MRPYCPGINCPVKATCSRFRAQIDVKKEIHFSETPYDHGKKKCGFYLHGNATDSLSTHIENLENGNQHKDGPEVG
jgi:hypothetical protein